MRLRRWLAAGLVVTALPMSIAACGNDDSKSVNTNDKDGGSSAGAPAPSSYVGLTKKDAIDKAEASDVTWRILREDGEQFPATLDYNPERINFEIDNGKVTKATFG